MSTVRNSEKPRLTDAGFEVDRGDRDDGAQPGQHEPNGKGALRPPAFLQQVLRVRLLRRLSRVLT